MAVPIPALLAPLRPLVLATRSENSVREDFMPTVLALAMLLPITSRLRLELFKPDRPV